MGIADQNFQDRSSLLVQKMDFVNDQQSDQIHQSTISCLPRHDIPFFRRADDDLGLLDLSLSSRVNPDIAGRRKTKTRTDKVSIDR